MLYCMRSLFHHSATVLYCQYTPSDGFRRLGLYAIDKVKSTDILLNLMVALGAVRTSSQNHLEGTCVHCRCCLSQSSTLDRCDGVL